MASIYNKMNDKPKLKSIETYIFPCWHWTSMSRCITLWNSCLWKNERNIFQFSLIRKHPRNSKQGWLGRKFKFGNLHNVNWQKESNKDFQLLYQMYLYKFFMKGLWCQRFCHCSANLKIMKNWYNVYINTNSKEFFDEDSSLFLHNWTMYIRTKFIHTSTAVGRPGTSRWDDFLPGFFTWTWTGVFLATWTWIGDFVPSLCVSMAINHRLYVFQSMTAIPVRSALRNSSDTPFGKGMWCQRIQTS